MSDYLILLLLYLLLTPPSFCLFKKNKKKGIVNLIITLCCSLILCWCLFNSSGGVGLVYYVLWVSFLLIQFTVLIVWLAIRRLKSKR